RPGADPQPSELASENPRSWASGAQVRGELLRNDDVDEVAAAARAELHHAVGLGEQRVVAAEADVEARVPLRAALADDDRPRGDGLTAVALDPESLRLGVATVARRRGALLLRHG